MKPPMTQNISAPEGSKAGETLDPEGPEAKLYQLLDDINTAFDMFKPEMNGFEKYVRKKIKEAHKIIHSPDGYKLVYTL